MHSWAPSRSRRRVLLGGLSSLALGAAAQNQGASPDALAAALSSGAEVPALRSLLVARDGVLIGERYYGGAQADQLLPINSATKSVCSILVGQALDQQKLRSLTQTVGELLPEQAQKQPDAPANRLTLGQILTGTTGLAYDFPDLPALLGAPDPVQHVLGLKNDGRPAGQWSYNDAAVSLVAAILERAQGLALPELARRDLFEPLGIESSTWQKDRSGHAMAYMGLSLKPRDFLKILSVMAQPGPSSQAGARPIVSREWVAESTRRHVASTWDVAPVSDTGYGYLWFTGTLQGHAVYWAWGYGGQFGLCIPALKLAIATAATNPPPQALRAQTAAVMAVVARVVQAYGRGTGLVIGKRASLLPEARQAL